MSPQRPGRRLSHAATIRDVARAAGVSVATVSRALNDRGHVADAVRQRVREAAEALHYAPHPGARDLSSRRTGTLGVVLPGLHGATETALVRGIDDVAGAHGLRLVLATHRDREDDQAAAIAALRGRVDGLLVKATGDARMLRELAAVPLVLLNGAAGPGLPGIALNHHGGAVAMVRHLLARGHRRIAFIAGPAGRTAAMAREAGYRHAMDDAGLPACVVPGGFDEASGAAAAGVLLADSTRPEAIFAGNDAMAFGALFAMARAGVRVPRDIALAGFDDVPLAALAQPALTTVRADMATLGARATRMLLDGADPDAAERMDAPLVVRESCAGPAGWEI